MSRGGAPSATIVVPAHDEERGLRRLLPALLQDAAPGEFTIIVVCNGCSDQSATEAARHGADVQVIELEEASKAAALDAGAAQVRAFPIVFIDADVLIDTGSVRRLTERLKDGSILAAAPVREVDRAGVSVLANGYYDVWERLPAVRSGLFGRGVIALSEEGFQRVAGLPRFLSDDLAYSEAFLPSEREVTRDTLVTVWPARTWRSLLNRRVRVVRGNRELSEAGARSAAASTSTRDLISIARDEPRLLPHIATFAVTALIARARARRTVTAWARDETSRGA